MKSKYNILEKKVFIFIIEHESTGNYNVSLPLNTNELILKSFGIEEKENCFLLKFAENTDLSKYVFFQKAFINNNHYFQVENNILKLNFEDTFVLKSLLIEFWIKKE